MDFHSELVKITEFAPLEDYLVKKKAGELLKTSQANIITVSVNPSNLVELTKVGERFAPDSCVVGKDLKYVLHEKLIPNKEKPTHFETRASLQDLSSFDSTFPRVLPIIPDMIVRQRPGISYQPIKEASYYSTSQESSLIEQDQRSVNSDLPPGQLPKQVGRVFASGKTLNDPKSNLSKSSKLNKPLNPSNPSKNHPEKPVVTIKRSNSSKEPTKTSSIEKTFKDIRNHASSLSMKKKPKKRVKTILKKNKSEDTNLSSNSEKKTVTWEEDEKNLQKEHEEKRKMHLDKFKYQCPSYLREKETETLNRLEKIVEEEKELLNDKPVITPESSQGSKYKKTYEELEREIKNIREMLSDDRENENPEEAEDEDYEEREISDYDEESDNHENASIDYNYSSDDCKDDKEWMKPRFK